MNDLILEYINYNKDRIIIKNIDFNFERRNKLIHYSIPCVSFTSYFGKKMQRINNIAVKNISEEMTSGNNTEFFSNIFSDFINKYIKVFYEYKKSENKIEQNLSLEEYKKSFIILPCISFNKERNFVKFKKLLDLITQKTCIKNSYDSVKYINRFNNECDISSSCKNYNDFSKYYSINSLPIKYNSDYNIIFIDDIVNTGNTFKNYSRKIIENNKHNDCKSILCLSFSQVFSYEEHKYNWLNDYNKLNKNIIEIDYTFDKFKIIKNDFYELNPINMAYICFYASKVKYKY